LRVAQLVFRLSIAEPTDLMLHRRDFAADLSDHLPDGPLLLCPLRDWLLRADTPGWVRDVVWRELVGRARAGSSWLVVAMGMAMPGLRREVRGLLSAYGGDREDVESAVAEGFVRELSRIDVDGQGLCRALLRAGRRAGEAQLFQDAAIDAAVWSQFASRAPQAPYGHPDLVLVDAVRKGVLSREDAWLIGTTRLESVPVGQVAVEAGQLPNTLLVRRHRAELKLRDAIATGDVTCPSYVDSQATRSGRSKAV
jgi:hypothetical protein